MWPMFAWYKQALSLDGIARVILHILFLENSKRDLDFDMTWGWGGDGVGGMGGEAIALCKIFIKPKMNQFGDKVRK